MPIQSIPRYHSADDDGGSGGDGEQNGKVKASDIINRYGQTNDSILRMAEELAKYENRNWNLREKNRTLTQDLEAARAKLPAEGSVVLTKDDEADLSAYRALGKPQEVKTALEAKSTAERDLATLRRNEQLRQAADVHGYKAGLLGKVPSLADKQIEIKEVEEDGKKVKRAFVGDSPLPDFIQANDPDFVEALPAKQEQKPQPYDINAGARSNGNAPTITDEERKAAQRRYSATF